MPRFLIEVPHENTEEACNRAIQTFMATGSHFVTNAEWGCHDNEHKAWILLEIGSRQEALTILPPAFRAVAKVTEVERFGPEEMKTAAQDHKN
ncbi:MAG: hypothetical protein WD751_02150 [Anaerolineales bacterium]